MTHECELMAGSGNRRCAEESSNGYKCTRHYEHDGDHVACGSDDGHHELDRWSQ